MASSHELLAKDYLVKIGLICKAGRVTGWPGGRVGIFATSCYHLLLFPIFYDQLLLWPTVHNLGTSHRK